MPQYPSFSAGQRITAGLLQSVVPVIVTKPATTARLSTVTPTDDPDLSFLLAANATYYIEFNVKYAAAVVTNVVGFRTAWTVPVGASGLRTSQGAGATAVEATAQDDTMHTGVHGYNSTTLVYGGRSSSDTNQLLCIETAIMTTSSAGTCAFQWSQGTTNASHAASVFSGSFMRITRLA